MPAHGRQSTRWRLRCLWNCDGNGMPARPRRNCPAHLPRLSCPFYMISGQLCPHNSRLQHRHNSKGHSQELVACNNRPWLSMKCSVPFDASKFARKAVFVPNRRWSCCVRPSTEHIWYAHFSDVLLAHSRCNGDRQMIEVELENDLEINFSFRFRFTFVAWMSLLIDSICSVCAFHARIESAYL